MPSTKQTDDMIDMESDTHSMSDTDSVPRKYMDYVQYGKAKTKRGGNGTIALFPSNNARRFAVNAVTGHKYDGVYAMSHQSRRYFRVTDATAPVQFRDDEKGVRRAYHSRDPNTFYYDSPEEYVKYAKIRGIRPSITKSDMFQWHAKRRELFGDDEFVFVEDETGNTLVR
jgi:hypothetical protein